MVSNETYVGDKRLQKKAPLDYLTKKPNPNQKVESNYLWDDHEAIIDRETWDKAQEILEKRKELAKVGIHKTNREHHFLYGKVFCGECGAPFLRRTLKAAGGFKTQSTYKAWNCRNRQKGKGNERCGNRFIKEEELMLFQLDEPEMVKTENIVLPPKEAETDDRAEIAGRTVKQIINILPPEWEDTFGRPITSIGEINLLEQRHYAADWDVLRPAKELAEYSTLTSEDLEELLHEAEKIIEGWPIPDEHGAGESADNGDGESAGVGTECGADVGAGTEENGDRADL